MTEHDARPRQSERHPMVTPSRSAAPRYRGVPHPGGGAIGAIGHAPTRRTSPAAAVPSPAEPPTTPIPIPQPRAAPAPAPATTAAPVPTVAAPAHQPSTTTTPPRRLAIVIAAAAAAVTVVVLVAGGWWWFHLPSEAGIATTSTASSAAPTPDPSSGPLPTPAGPRGGSGSGCPTATALAQTYRTAGSTPGRAGAQPAGPVSCAAGFAAVKLRSPQDAEAVNTIFRIGPRRAFSKPALARSAPTTPTPPRAASSSPTPQPPGWAASPPPPPPPAPGPRTPPRCRCSAWRPAAMSPATGR